jgi:hypothetical protein
MAGTIDLYTFENEDGPVLTWHTLFSQEAKAHARKYGYRVICNEYEWSDSYPVPEWDFTPKPSDDEEESTDD